MRSLALKVSITTVNMDLQNAYFSFKLLVFPLFYPLQHVIPPSVCEDWNLYPQFIAWRAYHLLYQHRSSYALKHSFCYFLALKSSAKRRSVNHCRNLSSIFPKTDAFGIFEAIKKSPFLNGNFLLSSPSANDSAENVADAR